jgi:hypothetical protein
MDKKIYTIVLISIYFSITYLFINYKKIIILIMKENLSLIYINKFITIKNKNLIQKNNLIKFFNFFLNNRIAFNK